MALNIIPTFENFNSEIEPFELYYERFSNCCQHHKIVDKIDIKIFLLNSIGSKIYWILRNLASPKKLTDLNLEEILQFLNDNFNPKKNVILNRFKFNTIKQEMGESINDYVLRIKMQAEKCNFNTFYQEAIRDRFVAGLANENIIKRLLSEDEINFNDALKIASAMEFAQSNTQVFSTGKILNKIQKREFKKINCKHCGKSNHPQEKCYF